MASTPPLQIHSTAPTPHTPQHGPSFDSPRRHSARLSQRRIAQENQSTPEKPSQSHRTSRHRKSPSTTPTTSFRLESAENTPRRKSGRRVQITSPSSPDIASLAPTPVKSSNPAFLSTTTLMADGMLPTPVKTPRKKNVPNVNAAARALFQDQPVLGEETMSSSRRGRKNKRYNGFSLESFPAEDESGPTGIQIFTDSRDSVPQNDQREGNPFIEISEVEPASTAKMNGTSKRRKLSGHHKRDPEVEEAIKNDEGLVYVFRGKKVFRKFTEDDEEEEEIDTEDLGLLQRSPDGSSIVKPLRTLTRKSVKPTRLFQTEEQKRTREAEKEEEAVTDIEEPNIDPSPSTPVKTVEAKHLVSPPSTRRGLRSSTKKEAGDDSNAALVAPKVTTRDRKKASPFDSWKRTKSGSSAAESSKSKKRSFAESVADVEVTTSKKTKA